MNGANSHIPEDPNEFFLWLKTGSERFWANIEIKKGIFGFQVQKNTKWLKGLSESEIGDYEKELGFSFPEIYGIFLRNMNGTDQPALNIYGNSENIAYAPHYYSFPRDLERIKNNIQWIFEEFRVDEEMVNREKIPHLIPIVDHRFLIADNCAENPVLSMAGTDVISYAPNLESFLAADIFENHSMVMTDANLQVKFWLDEEEIDLEN